MLSQDAYGSDTDVTIGGTTLPVPDLAVGRLVKTDQEIESQIDNFLAPRRTADAAGARRRSLVTGYDFLDRRRRRRQRASSSRRCGTGRRPHDTLIDRNGDAARRPWTTQPSSAASCLAIRSHDIVFLAGHFSANDTLAADFDDIAERHASSRPTAANAGAPEEHPGAQRGLPLRLQHRRRRRRSSAHRHQRLDPADGPAGRAADRRHRLPVRRHRLPRVQRAALPRARPPAARGAGDGTADPIAVGKALVLAKQDYLAGLTTCPASTRRRVLQATLYGLPMTGFDAPGRAPLDDAAVRSCPATVGSSRDQGGRSAYETADTLGRRLARRPSARPRLEDGSTAAATS